MSQDKSTQNDPERTLVTLEQLSQTIEVMTSVVNRLRQHLSEQLRAQTEAKLSAEAAAEQKPTRESANDSQPQNTGDEAVEPASRQASQAEAVEKESFVVEIRQPDHGPAGKNGKILH